ncbi:MAG: lactonase family protein, partial [Deinococcota bacterium]|nr:lactonase family protein [Deinococcota bacterium]
EVSRSELGPGLVFRFAISEPYALFFNIHPNGDFAHLLDIDPASTTFHEIVAKVALEPLTNAPQPDASPWEAESRRAALTPDGRWGFVSHGGDGLISVIDTERGEVTSMLEVPSSLSGGGYLIALQPDMRMVDTVGR